LVYVTSSRKENKTKFSEIEYQCWKNKFEPSFITTEKNKLKNLHKKAKKKKCPILMKKCRIIVRKIKRAINVHIPIKKR
jgi:hypothetical protein